MPLRLGVFALVVLAGSFAMFKSLGGNVPGPHIFHSLGISEGYHVKLCTPSAKTTRVPAAPPPAPGAWRAEPPTPTVGTELMGGSLGGLAYIFGGQSYLGYSLSTVVTYDPSTRRYGRAPDMPVRADHLVVVTWHGDLYVVAGYHDSNPIARFMRYSPSDRRWTDLPPPPLARGAAGGAVIGDKLYVAGGGPRTSPNQRATPYRTLEIYDFRSGRWTNGPPMPTARHHVVAGAVGGDLYVVGGRMPSTLASNLVERYDPRTRRWSEVAPLPLGVGAAMAVTTRGELIVAGGDDEQGWDKGRGWVTPATWAYSPRRNSWRRLPNMLAPRHASAAAYVDGRLYTFDGDMCPGVHRTNTAQSLAVQ